MEPRVLFGDLNSGVQVGVNHGQIQVDASLDPLKELPRVSEAEYGSYMDQNEDECLPGTRTGLLDEITSWARSPDGKCILWLNGMAGTGKSTISRTVAGNFKKNGLLGASFFFKRGEAGRGSAREFFPTIARQLMVRYRELVVPIRQVMQADPGITTTSLSEQFDRLIYQPLRSLGPQTRERSTVVIVVDALDECDDEQDVRVILRSLPSLQGVEALNVRIFLTSRPELPIRQAFAEMPNQGFQDFVLHEMISQEATEHDMALFLKDRFTRIRTSRRLPELWPRDEDLQTLVTMSVPLFISAATLCRFIGDPKWQPTVRLAEVLKNQSKYATKMEKTYLPIFERLLSGQDEDDSEILLREFQQIIGTIIFLFESLSINALAALLNLPADTISNRLESFSSILHIPDNQDRDRPVRVLHSSLRDFLVHSKTQFHVDAEKQHTQLVHRCFVILSEKLVKSQSSNIDSPNSNNLNGDNAVNTGVHPLFPRRSLPSEVQYASQYWAYHLLQSTRDPSVIESATVLMQKQLCPFLSASDSSRLASLDIHTLDGMSNLFS